MKQGPPEPLTANSGLGGEQPLSLNPAEVPPEKSLVISNTTLSFTFPTTRGLNSALTEVSLMPAKVAPLESPLRSDKLNLKSSFKSEWTWWKFLSRTTSAL